MANVYSPPTYRERKEEHKFKKLMFRPKQVGIDIRAGYCSNVRKKSQAYKLGVRSGWRIVNIDGDRVPKEDKEIAALIRSCIDSGSKFPITFRLPKTNTCAGYKAGDLVEALDSTGRQWNGCLIIDITEEKFTIVYLHNAVRSKKFQAMLRWPVDGAKKIKRNPDLDEDYNEELDEENDDDEVGEDDWDAFDRSRAKTKKSRKSAKKEEEDDILFDMEEEVKIETSTKKLLKAAIGKEAKANANAMKNEYSRVAMACHHKGKIRQVLQYLEEKLSDIKHPTRVLKALLLSSYLMAFGEKICCKAVVKHLSKRINKAAKISTLAKTAAGKAAVSDIVNKIGPSVAELVNNPTALAKVRAQAKKSTEEKLTLAPPPGETGGHPGSSSSNGASNSFNKLTELTSEAMSAPAKPKPKPEPIGGLDLSAIFDDDGTAPSNQKYGMGKIEVDFMREEDGGEADSPINQGNYGSPPPTAAMGTMEISQPPSVQLPAQNLWGTGLVDLSLSNQPKSQPKKEKKLTLNQMQGEDVIIDGW
ncbi:hypothetical protein AAMO2058_000117800 [Amorphochlora amoebiformis]